MRISDWSQTCALPIFLKSRGLEWNEVRIDTDPAEREKMVALARRTSVPQIFVGDTHVGGYEDMMALHRAGSSSRCCPASPGRAGAAGRQARAASGIISGCFSLPTPGLPPPGVLLHGPHPLHHTPRPEDRPVGQE